MAIVYALRGSASPYSGRYGPGGILTTAIDSGQITSSAGGLSGTVIDLTNIGGALKYLSIPGGYNTPNGRTISVLIRLAPSYTGAPSGSRALWALTSGNGNSALYTELRHDVTTGNLTPVGRNEVNASTLGTAPGSWSPTSGTYYDIVFTWDGTTSANLVNIYVDAVKLGTGVTAAAAMSASMTNQWYKAIQIGTNTNVNACAFKLDEFVIWDTIITPSSVALVGGTGSLNGASRTALVDVVSYNGIPAAADVRSGTPITTTTGTCAVPGAADVRSGTAVDATTGSLAVPSRTKVLLGVATDNTTGTLPPQMQVVGHGARVG